MYNSHRHGWTDIKQITRAKSRQILNLKENIPEYCGTEDLIKDSFYPKNVANREK